MALIGQKDRPQGETERFNSTAVLPWRLRNTPIPFDQFAKPNGGNYTPVEWGQVPDNELFYSASTMVEDGEIVPTHVLMPLNPTTIFMLAEQFPQFLFAVDQTVQYLDGGRVNKWLDPIEMQKDYLWFLYNDPVLPYGYNAWRSVTPIMNIPEEAHEL